MSYPNAHILVRAQGAFGTPAGVEKWSAGFRFGVPGMDVPYDVNNLQAFANACHTALGVAHASGNLGMGTSTYFNNVTAARVGVGGKYDPPTQQTTISVGAGTTGSTTPVLPWTSALVLSLRTARPRGYASNGRVYWPAQAAGIIAGTGRVTASNITTRLSVFRTAINAMNTAAGNYAFGMVLCVISNVGTGLAAAVTGLRMDDRLDNVERRENAQVPVYSTTPIP